MDLLGSVESLKTTSTLTTAFYQKYFLTLETLYISTVIMAGAIATNVTTSGSSGLSYFYYDFWEDYGDPRSSHLPLMHGGPWKVCAISFAYWYFVRVFGPSFMKNREPFDLRSLMLLHNSFLIGVNGCGFLVGLWITDLFKSTLYCGPIAHQFGFKDILSIYLGYLYFLTKIFDFGDTIYFVLRKKYNQATFLHVFHHGVMPIVGYVGIKFHPGGYSGFLPMINILVHAVMYTYYALACAGPEMKKHLWWKKHITQMQLVQFVLVFFHSLNALVNPSCTWPLILALLEGGHAILFFFMFFSFYQAAYVKGPAKSTNKVETKVE